uniref:Uncharacterized protein n=1 Tax=Anguilla anguilla TaxID=7936 RepID=A0A0E9UII7_ANGAN
MSRQICTDAMRATIPIDCMLLCITMMIILLNIKNCLTT